MAVVTGTLTDFGLDVLAARSPRVIFTASNPAVLGSRLLSTTSITVTPSSTGVFDVDLQPTEDLTPAVWYSIRVEWLDSEGGYLGVDLVDWPLYVPDDGGAIGDLVRVPANPAHVWVDIEEPEQPTPGLWWLELNPKDPDDPRNTGNLYQWQ